MNFQEACYDLAFGIASALQGNAERQNEYEIAERLAKPIETFGQAICDLIVDSVAVALKNDPELHLATPCGDESCRRCYD